MGFRSVSLESMVLYEKIFSLSRKSMSLTSFLFRQNLSRSFPAKLECGQKWSILRSAVHSSVLTSGVLVSGAGPLCLQG